MQNAAIKPFHALLSVIAFSAMSGFAEITAEMESVTPVAAKTTGEKWWNGNCERIDADIKKMEGKIDVAFVGDSITARWRDSENWKKHWGTYRAMNMGIGMSPSCRWSMPSPATVMPPYSQLEEKTFGNASICWIAL